MDDYNTWYILMFTVKRVYLISLSKIKVSEKVDFIAVKITQILVNIQEKSLDIIRIFYKKNGMNIS